MLVFKEFYKNLTSDRLQFCSLIYSSTAPNVLLSALTRAMRAFLLFAFLVGSAHAQTGPEVYLQFTSGWSWNGSLGETTYGPTTQVLVLFPDGTAINELPAEPVASFSPAAIRATFDPDDRPARVGTWRRSDSVLTLTFDGDSQSFARISKGWWDGEEPLDPDATDGIYLPTRPLAASDLIGEWETAEAYAANALTGDEFDISEAVFSFGPGGVLIVDGPDERTTGRWSLDGVWLSVELAGQASVLPAYTVSEEDREDPPSEIWIGDMLWMPR